MGDEIEGDLTDRREVRDDREVRVQLTKTHDGQWVQNVGRATFRLSITKVLLSSTFNDHY